MRSSQVKQCINDWIVSGPNSVQSLSVGGSLLTVNVDLSTGKLHDSDILSPSFSHLCR